jgi:hypothetical protein
VPWDVYDGQLLLKGADCGNNNTTTKLTVGSGDPEDYIYKNAYYWDSDAEEWVLVPLEGVEQEGDWFVGTATAKNTVAVNDVDPTYFAAHTCRRFQVEPDPDPDPDPDPIVSSDCDPKAVPAPAKAAGLTKLAFCAPFDSISEFSMSSNNNEWQTVPPGKLWSTYIGLNSTYRVPVANITDHTDGTISIKQVPNTTVARYLMTMGKDGSGWAIPKGTNDWYAEIRWNLTVGGPDKFPAFWTMSACHIVPYGNCWDNKFIEPDMWEKNTAITSTHWYQHSPYLKYERCNHIVNGTHTVGVGEWFVAGHLYTDGGTTSARQRYYKNNNLIYTRTTSTTGCTANNGSTTNAWFIRHMPNFALPILIGSHGDDVVRYDYVRVWVKP